MELRDNGGPRTRGASLALMTDPQLRLRVGRPSLSAPRHLPCPRLPDRPHRLDNRAPVTAGRTSQSRVSQGGARALHLLVALSWWSPSWPTYTESNDSGDGLPILTCSVLHHSVQDHPCRAAYPERLIVRGAAHQPRPALRGFAGRSAAAKCSSHSSWSNRSSSSRQCWAATSGAPSLRRDEGRLPSWGARSPDSAAHRP